MSRNEIIGGKETPKSRIVIASIAFIGYDQQSQVSAANCVGKFHATSETDPMIKQWFLIEALENWGLGTEYAQYIHIKMQSYKPSTTKNRVTKDYAVSITAMTGTNGLLQEAEWFQGYDSREAVDNTVNEYKAKWRGCRDLRVTAMQI